MSVQGKDWCGQEEAERTMGAWNTTAISPPPLQQYQPISLFPEGANTFPKSSGVFLRGRWVRKQIREAKVIDEMVRSQENTQEVDSRCTSPQVPEQHTGSSPGWSLPKLFPAASRP